MRPITSETPLANRQSQFSLRHAASFLCSLEIWLVAGIIAASVVFPRLLPVAVGIAAAFWVIRWAGTGRLSLRTPADWSITLLLLMVPVTLWATALPEDTVPQVYRLLTGVALYYAVVNWSAIPARLRLLVYGLLSTGLALAAFAPFSVLWPSSGKLPFVPDALYERFSLLVSDAVHPNVMAGYLVYLLPLAAGILLFGWRRLSRLQRILFAAVLIVMSAILFLTKSRGAWMALGAFFLLLVILRWRWGWLVFAAVLAGGIVVFSSLGIRPVLDALSSSDTISGIDGRIEIWSRAVYMIQDFPFTGIGIGSFTRVADTLYPFFLAAPGSIMHAHNLFLQLAVDLGLPGFIAWLAAYFLVIAAAWQVYRRGRQIQDGWIAGVGAGLLGSQLALAVHGITDAVTWGMVRPAPLIWALWGLAIAAWYAYVLPSTPKTNPPPSS